MTRALSILILFVFLVAPSFFAFASAAASQKANAKPMKEDVELSAELLDNPFGQVVNGEKTVVQVTFNNKGEQNYTVELITGMFVNPRGSAEIVRNLTAIGYDYLVQTMDHAELYYGFYAEFQPQDLDLIITMVYADENDRYYGVAYNQTVHIVEPEQSLFDLQLLFLYLILGTIFSGIAYMIYSAFFGGGKTKNQKGAAQKQAQKEAARAASELKEYDESWIPPHHLKKGTKKDEKSEKVEKTEKAD